MRAFILSLVAVFSLSAFAAELLACPVEGCGIDASLHAVTTTPADVEVEAWSWLAHDLALARLALAEVIVRAGGAAPPALASAS